MKPSKTFTVRVPVDTYELWKQTAEFEKLSLNAWIIKNVAYHFTSEGSRYAPVCVDGVIHIPAKPGEKLPRPIPKAVTQPVMTTKHKPRCQCALCKPPKP